MSVARWTPNLRRKPARFAKDCAPYVHPRLAARMAPSRMARRPSHFVLLGKLTVMRIPRVHLGCAPDWDRQRFRSPCAPVVTRETSLASGKGILKTRAGVVAGCAVGARLGKGQQRAFCAVTFTIAHAVRARRKSALLARC
jgi:hypothetical protein